MEFRIVAGSISIQSVPDTLEIFKSISSAHNTIVQAMDADKVAGEDHIYFAVRKALRAKENDYNVARDTGIEIMRYASGKRQIEEAFTMGIREGEMNVVLVVLGDIEYVQKSVAELRKIIEESPVTEYKESKKDVLADQFAITEKEIGAVGEEMIPYLVLERIALVDVLK